VNIDPKRYFDILISFLALSLLLTPAIIIMTLLVVSGQPVLVRRHRVGKHGRMLKLFEFPTSVADEGAMESIGGCEGERPTRLGGFLRQYGIDRWPWLLSVLKGDLSIVGPRAELPRYVGCYPTEVRKKVLSVKPGLVDWSSLEIRQEQSLLKGLEGEALEEAYVERVLPIKLAHAQRYIDTRSLKTDMLILFKSLFR
jgi:lipopolysaccharide/colanic/teichoic acid biosynthesis glycosyltransferase